ncbi:MAG: hypothetical protein ABIB11_06130, partial [Candidatus Omnitrophota bacterium]
GYTPEEQEPPKKSSSAGGIQQNVNELLAVGRTNFSMGVNNITVLEDLLTSGEPVTDEEKESVRNALVAVLEDRNSENDILVRKQAALALRLGIFASRDTYAILLKVANMAVPEGFEEAQNLKAQADYSAQYQLANALLSYTPKGDEIVVQRDAQAIGIFVSELKRSDALRNYLLSIKPGQDTRTYYVLNDSSKTEKQIRSELGLDELNINLRFINKEKATQFEMRQLLLGKLRDKNITQLRLFASSDIDMNVWAARDSIEILLVVLEDKRFEIISDYSHMHSEYIKKYEVILSQA